tara:strand:+ start:467 stop:799 length:333 start_codon:yes stop_codon:yes gene_type:complete
MKSEGVIDHIIPVGSDTDDLFWCEDNWWLLCDVPKPSNNFTPCNSWKSTHFDGTYGKRKIVAESRDLEGIAKRRREIIEARRKAGLSAVGPAMERCPESVSLGTDETRET